MGEFVLSVGESLRPLGDWAAARPVVAVLGVLAVVFVVRLVATFLRLRVERAALFGGRGGRPGGAFWFL